MKMAPSTASQALARMVFLPRPPLSASPPLIRMSSPKLPFLGDLGAGLGAHELIVAAGKLAFARLGKGLSQKLGDGEPEHAVAEELEPLIVLVRLERGSARSHG